jgi:hypothetical protein
MGAGQVKGKLLKGLRKSIYTLTTVLHCQAVIYDYTCYRSILGCVSFYKEKCLLLSFYYYFRHRLHSNP